MGDDAGPEAVREAGRPGHPHADDEEHHTQRARRVASDPSTKRDNARAGDHRGEAGEHRGRGDVTVEQPGPQVLADSAREAGSMAGRGEAMAMEGGTPRSTRTGVANVQLPS